MYHRLNEGWVIFKISFSVNIAFIYKRHSLYFSFCFSLVDYLFVCLLPYEELVFPPTLSQALLPACLIISFIIVHEHVLNNKLLILF